ncbi:3-carboxy-cis,cis-muconate cycloisomerase [Usitatibacter rugosus]|uniref:3-carboxy-cis,cis-muconate cycloisomerase n=1 Tax=Usitatibacter rugosus TaxID=2732067 RepID=A0A6M4GVW7_9PROT|nr:lyase family protein [Usitatibacter rugosus]QJR11441.1 3-carboxy-cis,cis-muconate cycloisomerase [Usitatibacter rugosus]
MSMNPAARTLLRSSFEAALGGPAFVRAMLDFETALARAQAEEGVIPASSAAAIENAARQVMDAESLVAEGKRSVSIAVPFVEALQARVASAAPEAAAHVHYGATSQDAIDTAMVMAVRRCLDEADGCLATAVAALATRAREHRDTPMLGRTLMQPALPITAGLKLARWAAALEGDRRRIEGARGALAIQLGGPVGALEKLGAKGPAVRARVARQLGLVDAPAWHTHRGAWIDLLDRIGNTILTIGKIARDLSLLSQPEVGEMMEAAPRAGIGASSAMPHKRNPVGCAHALAAATRAPGLLATIHAAALGEHERALGGWQAELATVPELMGALGSSLDFLERIGPSLVIDAARMAENLRAQPEVHVAGGASKEGLRSALDELLKEIAR